MNRLTSVARYLAIVAAVAPLCAGCFPDETAVDTNWKVTNNVSDWRDEVVYQLLVDRFGNGNLDNDQGINPAGLARYQGGDWQGVIDHIDYLQALGVTAVWVSPVVRNVDTDASVDGYHGYWANDLTHTNPHFGDLDTLRKMVNTLHAHNIKVILDIVTNHLGQLFFYDINGNGVPDTNVYGSGCPQDQLNRGCANPQISHITEYDPDFDSRGVQAYTSLGFSGPAPIYWLYLPEIHRMPPLPVEFQNKDWYNKKGRILDYSIAEQRLTGDFPGGLKDVNTLIPEVQTAMTRAYTYWIGAADFDAFRIDTLKHVEHEFWQKFCPGVREYCKQKGKKNFFMFGEAFDGDNQLVGSFTFNNEVDSVFYFPQKFSVYDRVFKENNPTHDIETEWNARTTSYDSTAHADGPTDKDGKGLTTPQLMVNFLDNHDIPRFLFDKPCTGKGNCPALWNALSLLLTEQGIPCVYYGTEQEFHGGNDPANRERLWDSNYDTSGNTFAWIRQLIDVRRKFRPLRQGLTQVRWSTMRTGAERDAGMFAFERTTDDKKTALVVLNVSDTNMGSTQAPDDQGASKMVVGFAPGTTLTNVLAPPPGSGSIPETFTVGADGSVAVTLPPRSQVILVAQSDAAGIDPLPLSPVLPSKAGPASPDMGH